MPNEPTVDEFFAGHDASRSVFDAVHAAVVDLGPSELRVTKSQVAFRRRLNFAFAWIPGMYLDTADVPLVLTIALRRRDVSTRWKQVVEPARGRFTHHLELRDPGEVDEEVARWLREAWEAAG